MREGYVEGWAPTGGSLMTARMLPEGLDRVSGGDDGADEKADGGDGADPRGDINPCGWQVPRHTGD
jgi:hypothetical protein